MDTRDFGEFKSGKLIPIKVQGTGETDYSFVPNPLPPPSLQMSDKLWMLVSDASRAIGELNGASDNLLNPRLLLPPLQQNEAIASNKIEGTYTTPEQLLLAFDGDADSNAQANEAWRDVGNYYRALREGYDELSAGKPIECNLIKKLHAILLTGARSSKDPRPGEFRDKQAYVGNADNRRRYIPPPVSEMSECLTAFEEFLLATEWKFHPLVRAFLVHYQFEAIHPFGDGNGRVGRLLLSLTIHHWLKLDLPWLYLSEHFYATRTEYLSNLYRISTEGRWEDWLEYCLRGTIKQAAASCRRLKALSKLRAKYRKMVKNEKRLPVIIEGLFSTPALRVVEVERQHNIKYDTARADIAKLEQMGILAEVAGFRPKAFVASAICEIAYGETVAPAQSAV